MPTNITTPAWVHHAVFYQIFPDRFARSPRTPHPPGIQFKPWGSPPEEQGYQGGDLYGIVDRLDYLSELGINALYLNPIFSSASNHRYHAFDYLQVDPLLGGNEALRELLDQAHARGIRVILDGVFNHASRGFWAFHHILENDLKSPYADWFHIKGLPLRPYQEPGEKKPLNYAAWWDLPALPKFNTDNPGVRQYLFHVARYWIDFGVDGWRLDVPADIDDDLFWQEFRRIVKAANPQAYIVGEIWHEAKRWLQGDQFDAVMNYLFSKAALPFFAARTFRAFSHHEYASLRPSDARAFAAQVEHFLGLYHWQINLAQMSMLDSHDTPRALWLAGEDKSALRLSLLFQMTMPGAPCVYYGSEIGLSGGPDPGCRGAFPWEQAALWDHELLAHYRQAIALRHACPVLRIGSYECLHAAGEQFAFRRALDGAEAIAAFNAAQTPAALTLPGHTGKYRHVWSAPGQVDAAGSLDLQIPPRAAVVLIKDNAR
jgi:neopullulanase